jgi:hypothetical protein
MNMTAAAITMASYVLGYWAIRGLAAPIRYILELMGASYTEDRYAVTGDAESGWDRSAWTSVKPTKGAWRVIVASLCMLHE